MIILLSAIIVPAFVALWAGYRMGYNSAKIDMDVEDIDWDAWEEKTRGS